MARLGFIGGSPPVSFVVIRNNVIIHLNFLTPATYLVTILLHDTEFSTQRPKAAL